MFPIALHILNEQRYSKEEGYVNFKLTENTKLSSSHDTCNIALSIPYGDLSYEISDILYSTDGGYTWIPLSNRRQDISLKDRPLGVSFKAKRYIGSLEGASFRFSHYLFDSSVEDVHVGVVASGEVEKLISPHSYDSGGNRIAYKQNTFKGLFSGFKELEEVSLLSLCNEPYDGSLPESAFENMFSGCTGIEDPPNGFNYKYFGGYRCCASMFEGCEKLDTTPTFEIRTVGVESFYDSFRWCLKLSLINIDFSKIIQPFEKSFAYMFSECQKLYAIPTNFFDSLLYTAKQCCWYMFNNCYEVLGAVELKPQLYDDSCFAFMFLNCKKFSNLKIHITAWNSVNGSTYGWLSGVNPIGTLTCKSVLGNYDTIQRGASYCPVDWNVEHFN